MILMLLLANRKGVGGKGGGGVQGGPGVNGLRLHMNNEIMIS